MANNYTLGRGEIWFAQYLTGTTTPGGELYLGNTPELSFTAEQENLDHYSSDRGVRIKDESVLLQLDYSGSFITDNISPDNLSYFFLGESMTSTATSTTVTGEAIADVMKGRTYQLGTSASNPAGVRKVSAVSVKKGATTFVAGTDYVLDATLARIEILTTGAIVEGDDLTVDYTIDVSSRSRVISKSKTIEGALRYIAYNPAGQNIDYFLPWVKITPNGDFTLKGDEWQQLPFTLEVLKKGTLESVYMEGRPI